MGNLLPLRIYLCCFLSSAFVQNIYVRCDNIRINLEELQGNITYTGHVRHDERTWYFPTVDGNTYALFIYIENMSMTYSEGIIKDKCSGELYLPEMKKICKLPVERCLLYTSSNISCDVRKLRNHITNSFTTCPKVLWYNLESLPQTLNMTARYQDRKSFSILYNNIQCNKIEDESSTTPASSPSTISNRRMSSSTEYIIVIVILIILLLVAVALLVFTRIRRRRRKKRSHSEERVLAVDADNEEPLNSTNPTPLEGDASVNHYECIPPVGNRAERVNVHNQLYTS